ncbi:MAG TPA: C45 family peptidase [Xanthobacteraceae bacterium]|nr:C45 family peptidase [Xanthobacteraceae bacterium]
MTGIALLTTEGDAYACGLAHGRRFAREIADNVATYLRRFAASGLHREAAFAEAARWHKAIAGHNGAYAEEMRGIADGSGQSEDDIALLNARYELAFTLFGQEARRQRAAELVEVAPDGCTTFGLLPEVTADRRTWLGQNWDWLEGVHGRTFVLRARRNAQPSFVCLTEAGIAGGKMGVNECGVGLVENGLASSNDGRNPYQKPFHVRCREVLDAERFDAAARPLTDTARTCSANVVIGAAGGDIVDIESSPDHVSRLHPEDGIITHSNHFLTGGHGESLLEKISPNTLYRADRMRALLAPHRDAVSVAHMRAAAADHFGAPYAICRHADPRAPADTRTMTVGAVLIDLEARTMHVANGPPCANAYVAFSL